MIILGILILVFMICWWYDWRQVQKRRQDEILITIQQFEQASMEGRPAEIMIRGRLK